jgi:hypothetical protein
MVLWSTPESIERGEASWLAVLETILAVAAYWGIAWYFDTHTHLLISVLVAPLLLLRSLESTELGVKWFVNYWNDNTWNKFKYISMIYKYFEPFFVVYLFLHLGFNEIYFSLDENDNIKKAHYLLIIYGYLFLSSVLYFFICPRANKNYKPNLVSINGASFSKPFIYFAFTIYALAVIFINIIIYNNGYFAEYYLIFNAGALFYVLLYFAFYVPLSVAPLVLGVVTKSIFIRFLATARFYKDGIFFISYNYAQAITCIDSIHKAEIIPDLSKVYDGFSIEMMAKEIHGKNIFIIISRKVIKFSWYFIATLYRWSLKSTCWLYLPIVYLAQPHHGTPKDDRLSLGEWYNGRWEWFCRFLAIFATVSLVASAVAPERFAQLYDLSPQAPILIYVLAFDLHNFPMWKWSGILSACITAFIYFYSDTPHRRYREFNELDERSCARIRLAYKTRYIAGAATIILSLGYAVLALPKINPASIPDWLGILRDLDLTTLPHWLGFIRWIYGPYLPNGGAVG